MPSDAAADPQAAAEAYAQMQWPDRQACGENSPPKSEGALRSPAERLEGSPPPELPKLQTELCPRQGDL